jgi:hypothetical protein
MTRFARMLIGLSLVAIAALAWWIWDLQDELKEARSQASELKVTRDNLEDRLNDVLDKVRMLRAAALDARVQSRELRHRLHRSQACNERYAGHLWLFPSSGPVGTRVHFVGDCFIFSAQSSRRGFVRSGFVRTDGIFLVRHLGGSDSSDECEQVVATVPFDLEIVRGRAEGFFTVGSEGTCSQQAEGSPQVQPGRYRVSVGCHACSTDGVFVVTD